MRVSILGAFDSKCEANESDSRQNRNTGPVENRVGELVILLSVSPPEL